MNDDIYDDGQGYNYSTFLWEKRLWENTIFKKFLKGKEIRQYENDIYIMRMSDEFALLFELDEDGGELVLTCTELESDF